MNKKELQKEIEELQVKVIDLCILIEDAKLEVDVGLLNYIKNRWKEK